MTDVGIGLETVTQDQYLDAGGTTSATVDLAIPSGKIVIASGIRVDSFGNAYMSADGPHPTDSTKWRFQMSINQQSGGSGYSMTCHCWMIVANAAG